VCGAAPAPGTAFCQEPRVPPRSAEEPRTSPRPFVTETVWCLDLRRPNGEGLWHHSSAHFRNLYVDGVDAVALERQALKPCDAAAFGHRKYDGRHVLPPALQNRPSPREVDGRRALLESLRAIDGGV
jgi:hypothetical protein